MSAAIYEILNLGNLCAILVILVVTLMALTRLSLLRPPVSDYFVANTR